MIFFFGRGTISPRGRLLNGNNSSFWLQANGQQFKITTAGLAQRQILDSIRDGETVYIMGYPEQNGKRVTIRPRIMLPERQADPTAMGALFNQILEAHTGN